MIHTSKRKLSVLVFSLMLLSLILSCTNIKNLSKTINRTPEQEITFIRKNPVAYYEESLPYINGTRPEDGVKRMEKLLSYHENYSPALQALGNYYIKKREYRNALVKFERLKKTDSVLFGDSYELYAIALAGDGQFIRASKHMEEFLNSPNATLVEPELIQRYKDLKRDYDFAIAYGKQLKMFTSVEDLQIKNMGTGINTPAYEYTPSMSLNAKRVIFTRREQYKDEDLYESYKDDSGHYQTATPITALNTKMNEGSASLSTDNKKLLLTYCDMNNVFGKCDIFISYFVEDVGWTPPVNLGDRINTKYWESQPQFGPNNNSIYFSSDRPGGFGGKDIWVAYLDDNDQWQEPINLGGNVNTAKDEELPFFHYDNETLYFSSDGWQGYGSSDVFLSKRINDREWEPAVNLGFPINTIDKEGGLIVQFDAEHGYFSSDKSDGNSQGATDIYQYTLPEPFRPKASTWVQGKIIDAESGQDIRASVYTTNLSSHRDLGKVVSSKEGNFLLTLPIGNLFSFNIMKDGYLFYSERLELLDSNANAINKTFFLQPIHVGTRMTLKNIFFKTDEYTLDEKSSVELDILVDFLKANKNVAIQIEGHTDNTGDAKYNQALSLQRSQSIERYLIHHGIAKFRLTALGFGDTKPAYNNETEEGRKNNRRCVIEILKR